MTAKKSTVKIHPPRRTKIWSWVIFFVLTALFSLPLIGSAPAPNEPQTLIVKLKEDADVSFLSDYGQPERLLGNFYRLTHTVPDAYARLSNRAEIVSLQQDGFLRASAILPSDPLYTADATSLAKQWYLPKIQVPEAWELTTGGSVTVAVADTGIDAKHEDLSDGRVGRGFLSYCQVRSSPSSPDCSVRIATELAPGVSSDDNGHGTIVAGILAAISNNGKGIAGINWNIRLMPIKILDAQGAGFASDLALGIKWAADQGADIINLSVGGEGLNGAEVLQEAIAYAFTKGVLIVASAGNDSADTGINLNTNPSLPVCADGGQNMVIGVTAVDAADKKARFANYGSNCVDIAAPGTGSFIDKQQKQGLVSTYFDPARPSEHNLYVYAAGTSLAAPMVSAAAALILSINPDLDVKILRDRILVSADNLDEANKSGCGTGSCVGQIGRGRLNALAAVTTKSPFGEGALLRDESGKIYFIEQNLKRQVSEYVLRQRFSGAAVSEITSQMLASLSLGPPLPPINGALVKAPDAPKVYIVEGEKLYALSYIAFISRNLRFSDVAELPQSEIGSYEAGGDGPILNGVLIKSRDHPAVWVVINGVRQPLSFFVWQQRFASSQIAELDPEEVERFAVGTGILYPPQAGTLVKGDGEAVVYLIEGGKRRGLNLAAFSNRNFVFSQVNILPQSEVEGYERGEDIVE